jgi:hypothetical protein
VADAAVLELAWTDTPAVGACIPESVAVHRPASGDLPFEPGAAGAVVLLDPPREHAARLVEEACRVACGPVIALAPLATFGGQPADALSPAGWTGREQAGPGELPLQFATSADAAEFEKKTLDDRERWLELFALGAFGPSDRRLWIWEPIEPRPLPAEVRLDPSRVTLWEPVAPQQGRKLRPKHERIADKARQAVRVATEVARIRTARLRSSSSSS